MSKIRWTEPASADFLGVIEWLKPKNPAAAARVGRRILDAVELLTTHPHLGKPGRSADTRELGVTRYPYIVVYAVEAGATASEPAQVAILRVLHEAMSWPPTDEMEQ
jgi:plasmid stabilization system protein ParE